jgi:SAM-dependent methyltransferase
VTGTSALECIPCPYCESSESTLWARERDFQVVRCNSCSLIYVNPRMPLDSIHLAVRTGAHGEEAQGLRVTSRRVGWKVRHYRALLADIFADVWVGRRAISWLDVGSGYGEVLEAVSALAPAGSRIEGLEPMHPKAEAARSRGLTVVEGYLHTSHPRVQFISFVDVFSHIPDFRAFLEDVRAVLEPGGEIFLQTGNLADLKRREEFPGELGVPDHLVFAGETHLRGFLREAGFDVIRLDCARVDTIPYFAKSVAKKLLGRPEHLRLPYTSRYRELMVRARGSQ